ncbi:MAG: hypothetical protein OI715_00065 (plasmid) [Candidatus Methanoperedens sp.]|nr:MAG: hypothetical protein OI715_00065 [Candidatus Methanoperedens sp.]
MTLKEHVLHYPAPMPMPLSWVNSEPKMQENEKLADKMKCEIYRMKEFSNMDINEYLLVHDADTYHILFNRDTGSCSCKGFTYNTGAAALPCEHLMKVRSVEASGTDVDKPSASLLDMIRALQGRTYVCKDCGKQTNRQQAEKSFNELGYISCSDCHDKSNAGRPGGRKPPKKKSKQEEEKLPAKQEPAKTPAKKPSDAEIDAQIEEAKAERFLQQRGSHYKVQGKERPDSHMIQKIANKHGISVELIEAIQTDDCAHIVVRGHLNDQFVDAVVHHDFETEYQMKVIEIVSRNPEILDHWEGTEVVIKEGAKIKINENGRDVVKDAKYFIVHALLSFKKFALRDGRTKAAAIAESMLLNQDFRDPEEKDSEETEARIVQESIDNRKAMKATA